MKKALVFVHIFMLRSLHADSSEFLSPSLLAASWNSGNDRVFSLMGWRELVRVEFLVPPEQ